MFKAIIESAPLRKKNQIKVGDVLRTDYGEDLHVTDVQWNPKKGAKVTADRKWEGKETGTVVLEYGKGGDISHVRGYFRVEGKRQVAWKLVREENHDGHHIQMFWAVFGKGRYSLPLWEIQRDLEEWAFAGTEEEADEAFLKVRDGFKLIDENDTWEKQD